MSIFSLDSAKNLQIKAADYSITLTPGMTLPKKDRKGLEAMKAVIEEIEKNPHNLTPELKKAIQTSLPQLEQLGANKAKLDVIGSALNYVPKTKTVDAITADLMKNPLARKMLSEKELAKIGIAGADEIAKLDKLIDARTEIKTLLEANKNNKLSVGDLRKVHSIFIDHQDAAKPITDALTDVKHGRVNLVSEFAGVKRNVQNGFESVLKAAKQLDSIDQQIIAAEQAGNSAKQIERLERSKKPHLTDFKKATDSSKHVHAGKILEMLEKNHPELYETAKAADKGLASHMDSTLKAATQAAEGAAKTGGNKWYSLFHGADALAEKAKTLKVKPEELKFHQKIRPGKAAAVAGIAAIGAYFLAGTGSKPGRHTEAEFARQQGQEPAMGR